MRNTFQKYLAFGASFVILLLPGIVSAQVGGGSTAGPTQFPNPLTASSLTEFLTKILDAIVLIVFPFIVLFIVYAGFKMVAAQGNSSKLEEAKRQIIYAIVGALIILSAGAISAAIKGTVEQVRGVPFSE